MPHKLTVIFVTFYGNGYGITILWLAPSPEKNITQYNRTIYIT